MWGEKQSFTSSARSLTHCHGWGQETGLEMFVHLAPDKVPRTVSLTTTNNPGLLNMCTPLIQVTQSSFNLKKHSRSTQLSCIAEPYSSLSCKSHTSLPLFFMKHAVCKYCLCLPRNALKKVLFISSFPPDHFAHM